MISDVMKYIAEERINETVSASASFGTVIASDPLQIRIEDRLLLDESMLIIPSQLMFRSVDISIGDQTRTIILSPGLLVGDKVIVLHLGSRWLLVGTLDEKE